MKSRIKSSEIPKKYSKYYNGISFPISKNKAFNIANIDENLKTDFYRNYGGDITFLSLNKYNIDLVKLEEKLYWQVQILNGDISGCGYYHGNITDWDGRFSKRDLKKLRCLIDVETGEYIYYPNTFWENVVRIITRRDI